MKARAQLLLSAAAVGLLLTGASAQTPREEQPRAGNQVRQQDPRPQGSQIERIQDPGRQAPAPQSSAPAPSNAQAQPQSTPPQERTQQSQPQQQGTQTTAPASSGQQQQPADNGQAPAANAQPNRQPSTTAQQPAQTQPQQPAPSQSQQTGQSQPQQPAQSQSRQTGQSQPARNNAAPGAQPRASGVVALSTQQQTRIGQAIARHNVRPLTNVSFSIAVGTRVPRSVTLRALSSDLVTFVPQYRGYSYFVVEEQIVIVEPSSLEIVSIVPYASSKTVAGGKAMTSRPVKLSTEQRDVVRKHAAERKVSTERKTSATVRKRYAPGDRVDREVTIETFPETVYTEVPSIRRYRYFRDDDDVLLIDPDEDRVVDVIR